MLIPEKIASALYGTKATEAEILLLKSSLPDPIIPVWVIELFRQYPLAGVCFELTEDNDKSTIGVELIWHSVPHLIEEALDSEPGRSVYGLGFLPVGACAIGSGNPYFLDLRDIQNEDPPLVRVLHDFGGEDSEIILINGVEVVCNQLSEFFQNAVVY